MRAVAIKKGQRLEKATGLKEMGTLRCDDCGEEFVIAAGDCVAESGHLRSPSSGQNWFVRDCLPAAQSKAKNISAGCARQKAKLMEIFGDSCPYFVTRLLSYFARKQEMPIRRIVSELLVIRSNRRQAPISYKPTYQDLSRLIVQNSNPRSRV